jgi:hypothetical protein
VECATRPPFRCRTWVHLALDGSELVVDVEKPAEPGQALVVTTTRRVTVVCPPSIDAECSSSDVSGVPESEGLTSDEHGGFPVHPLTCGNSVFAAGPSHDPTGREHTRHVTPADLSGIPSGSKPTAAAWADDCRRLAVAFAGGETFGVAVYTMRDATGPPVLDAPPWGVPGRVMAIDAERVDNGWLTVLIATTGTPAAARFLKLPVSARAIVNILPGGTDAWPTSRLRMVGGDSVRGAGL